MKNIILKICSIIVVALCTFLIVDNVKAESFYAGDYVSKIYAKKEKSGKKMYLRLQWIHRASDGQFVYCLDPWTVLDESAYYDPVYQWQYSNLSYDVLNKVNLITYYGYGYENHQDDYWYAVTQMLIWKTVDPGGDFYFTDSLNGNRIALYEQEMNEILKLVSEHSVMPSRSGDYIKASVGKDVEIIDNNHVLDKFRLIDPDGIVVSKTNDKLVVRSDIPRSSEITLNKEANKHSQESLIYINNNSQDIYFAGNYTLLGACMRIEFIDGSIKLFKKDANTLDLPTNKFVTLENAVYDVYDENNNLVGQIATNEHGEGNLEHLPLGKYYIKEASASIGYDIDTTTYEVELSFDKSNQELIVYEQLDLKKLEIFKKYQDSVTEEYYPEANIEFGIYNKEDNTLVATITTDEKGYASIELEYGEYIVKQLTTKDGYTKVDDFEIIVDEKSKEEIKRDLINYPYKVDVELPNTGTNVPKVEVIYFILIISKIYLVKRKCKD